MEEYKSILINKVNTEYGEDEVLSLPPEMVDPMCLERPKVTYYPSFWKLYNTVNHKGLFKYGDGFYYNFIVCFKGAFELMKKLNDMEKKESSKGKISYKKYKKLMQYIANSNLRLSKLIEQEITINELNDKAEKMSSTAKLGHLLFSRTDDERLLNIFAEELVERKEDYSRIVEISEKIGLIDALESENGFIQREFRFKAIPKEDFEYLKKCGEQYPDEKLHLLVNYINNNNSRLLSNNMDILLNETKEIFTKLIDEINKKEEKKISLWKRGIKPAIKLLSGGGLVAFNISLCLASGGTLTLPLLTSGLGGVGMIVEGVDSMNDALIKYE